MGKDREWPASSHSIKSPRQIGQQAEDQACRYLLRQGLRLVKRNYGCKVGEIDLIMCDRRTLIFVEVRYRKTSRFASPAETVTWHKQQKLIRAAQHFLLINPSLADWPCRFDVVSLAAATQPAKNLDITWLKNAFQLEN